MAAAKQRPRRARLVGATKALVRAVQEDDEALLDSTPAPQSDAADLRTAGLHDRRARPAPRRAQAAADQLAADGRADPPRRLDLAGDVRPQAPRSARPLLPRHPKRGPDPDRARDHRHHDRELLPERRVRLRDRRPAPARGPSGISSARTRLRPIAISGAIMGSLLAIATTVSPRWGPPWFSLTLGIVVGVMMIIYVALPSRLIGVEPKMSRRDKLTASALSTVVGTTVCTPPYVLGRIGILMLGVRYPADPGHRPDRRRLHPAGRRDRCGQRRQAQQPAGRRRRRRRRRRAPVAEYSSRCCAHPTSPAERSTAATS